MAANNALFLRRQSVTRPPIFNGVNFISWKERMENFIQFIELWNFVTEGPYEATILDANVEDKVHLTLNAKAMNVLYNALDDNEFTHVKGCKFAKKIWDKFREIHEGSNDVRKWKKIISSKQI